MAALCGICEVTAKAQRKDSLRCESKRSSRCLTVRGEISMERIVRVTSAFSGLGIAATQAVRADPKREWRDDMVRAAMDALGHER